MVAEAIPSLDSIAVFITAPDPVSRAGIASQLRGTHVMEATEPSVPDAVSVVVADSADAETLSTIRALRARGARRVLLLISRIDEKGILAVLEAGATGVLRRKEATQGHLLGAIRATAAGDGTLPPDLLGALLTQVGRIQRQVLHPRGLTFAGLSEREVNVLRLLADGLDTAEVSHRLFYSERTVKNIIHDVTTRMELRNRTHAVAYAIREGLI